MGLKPLHSADEAQSGLRTTPAEIDVQLSSSSCRTGDPEHRADCLVGDAEVAGNAAQPFPLRSGDNLWPAVLRDTPWLRGGGIAAGAAPLPGPKHAL